MAYKMENKDEVWEEETGIQQCEASVVFEPNNFSDLFLFVNMFFLWDRKQPISLSPCQSECFT